MINFLHKRRGSSKRGFTLIEGLVLLFIFSIGVITLYKVFTLGMEYIIESKKRLAAVSLANQSMEILRNTPYTDIGLLPAEGYAPGFDYLTFTHTTPTGLQDPDNVETINNLSFRVIYDIYFIDDPDDGTAATTDTIPEDYKAVRIAVLWGAGMADASNTSQRIELSSYFIPPHGQEGAVGTNGVLSVNVISTSGAAVESATVTAWPISGGAALGSIVTGTDGHAAFLNVPAAADEYRVRVVKGGHETIETLPIQPTLIPNYKDQSVWNGVITTINIVLGNLQDFTIYTKNPFCDSIADIDFDIYGGRIIGIDPSNGNANVYVYDTSATTNASGEFDVGADSDIDGTGQASTGQYHVSLTESGYTFWRLDPATFDAADTVDIPIGASTTSECNFIIMDDAKDSLFVHVTDNSTAGNPPIAGATVRLQDPLSTYDVTLLTDHFGYVYFPENDAEPLSNGVQYDITVSATGYNNDTSKHPTINGLITETIALEAS